MSLYVVGGPIGNPSDFSLHALEVLRKVNTVIGEERKPLAQLLRYHGITGKNYELLNEHSDESDENRLLELCKKGDVALLSDCGTPGFCDPGGRFVDKCLRNDIKVLPVPGASSLMCLLSICGVELHEFYFRGFIPAKTEDRGPAWKDLKRLEVPVILMDTPYRLEKTVEELKNHMEDRDCVIGLDLTQDTHQVIRGRPSEILSKVRGKKAEFILLILPLGFLGRNSDQSRRGSATKNRR